VEKLKYKGNKKQFEVNADVNFVLSDIDQNRDEPEQVYSLVRKAHNIIKKRQARS
jgi:N6-adenosine-specific RNA methylase IME4